MLTLANALANSDRFAEAEEAYRLAIEDERESQAIVRYNLANLYYRAGETAKSASNFRAVIKLAPQFKNAYYNLGKLHFHAGSYARAMGIFQSYRRQQRLMGNTVEKEDLYETAMLIADTAYRLKNYGLAVEEYRTAMRVQPSLDAPYQMLAEMYTQLGDVAYALDILTLGEREVENPRVLMQTKAQLYYDQQDYESSVESYSMLNFTVENNLERLETEIIKIENSATPTLQESVEKKAKLLEEYRYLQRDLDSIGLFYADALSQAGYNNLAIFTLQDVAKRVVSDKKLDQYGKADHKRRSVASSQALQLLESLYHAQNRLGEAFDFFKTLYSAAPVVVVPIIKNLLIRAYNEDEAVLQQRILDFYNKHGIVDDVYLLLGGKGGSR